MTARAYRRFVPGLIALVVAARPAPAAAEMGDPPIHYLVLFEEFEYGFNNDDNPLSWDSTFWVGGDRNRIWFKSEGEIATSDPEVDGEAQVLYSRLITPFWELQFGLRGDLAKRSDQTLHGRGHLVLGLEGLAPYEIEVESAIFVSHEGDVSARLRATYELFITQRLIAYPSVEIHVAAQSVPDFGVGSGFNDIEFGVRLGYQIARALTPYAGVSWNRAAAETARLKRASGNSASDIQGVVGLGFWF